ncbi:hypothetical protein [Bacteroides heparinolyticus]|uniref:hypothetical protein n=1 Tax=Prevotella heparinolytica TaxID=28113 RepID=UPI00359F99B0
MRAMHVICLVPKGDAMVENSLSFGFWGRTGSSEWRPTLPRIAEAAAPARVAFYPPCGMSEMGRQTGWLFLASP